jgi:hypothetical protein
VRGFLSKTKLRDIGVRLVLTAAFLNVVFYGQDGSNLPTWSAEQDPANQPQQDEAAKSQARRKKFEDAKKRLESGEPASAQVPNAPDGTFFVSPALATMLIGSSQPFCAFDIEGKTLTAATEWSLSEAQFGDLSTSGTPQIVAKAAGTFRVRARLGTHYAEANVTVLSGSTLPQGTKRWSAPEIPGYTIKEVVPAVPSANGPDVFVNEVNNEGNSLVRAFTSEGIQLWMVPVKGGISKVIPTFGSNYPSRP